MQHRFTDWLKVFGVAALYALFAHVVHLYLRSDTATSVFEPASGLALAALLIGGRRYGWSVLLGELLVALMTGSSLWERAPVALGNTFAALLGAWLLTRKGAPPPTMRSLRDFLRLTLQGGCVAGMVSALAENTALLAPGLVSSGIYFYNLLQLWMGYVLGVILISPLILVWQEKKIKQGALTVRFFEPVLLLGMTLLAGQIIFLGWFHDSVGNFAKGFLMFLFVAWVAVRLGVRGMTIALFMIAAQALLGAYYEVGYFQHDLAQTQLANFWFYMVTLSIVGMALATYFAERQQAEDALRTSVVSLQAILNNSPYIAWLKDAQGRYLQVNAVYVEYARLQDARQVVGKTDFDLWPRELAEKYRLDDAEVLASRRQKHVEELSLDGDQTHWVETFKTPLIDENGNVLGSTGFSRDITERKQRDLALQKLEAIIDSTDDAIVSETPSGIIQSWNQGAERIFGYSTAEILGKPMDLLIPPERLDEEHEILARLARGEKIEHFETVRQRKDGRLINISATISPIFGGQGKVVGISEIARDTTERKESELKMERLSRTHLLLSRVNEAIVRVQERDMLFATICSAAVESGLFRFAWIGILDEKRTGVIPVAHAGVEQGYTAKLNIRLDDERTGNGPTGRAIRTGMHVFCQDIQTDSAMEPWRDEALRRCYRSSGVFPIREAGSVVGAINVYAMDAHFFAPDITRLMLELAADISFALDVFAERVRRKLAEDGIRQLNLELESRVLERTQQLEAVNRELEAFSYSVSHDLRAPLRSIDGFSQILSKKYHEQLDATGKDYLERVRRASQRMGHLIDDLLLLSKVTRGALKREQINLSRIAENVADDLRKASPARNAQFAIQPDLSVHADPGLLRIVMDNLLGNAWKYSGKKPMAQIEFGMRDLNDERTFFVRDNGDGFNMDYAHKLFGAFQRLHGTNEFEGTGIGLATVQRIIHRHHGKVWAEAKEGEGATFYFTLPQRARETREGV